MVATRVRVFKFAYRRLILETLHATPSSVSRDSTVDNLHLGGWDSVRLYVRVNDVLLSIAIAPSSPILLSLIFRLVNALLVDSHHFQCANISFSYRYSKFVSDFSIVLHMQRLMRRIGL